MGTIGGKDGYAYAYHLGIRGYESRVSMGYGRWVLALASGDAIGIGHGIGYGGWGLAMGMGYWIGDGDIVGILIGGGRGTWGDASA